MVHYWLRLCYKKYAVPHWDRHISTFSHYFDAEDDVAAVKEAERLASEELDALPADLTTITGPYPNLCIKQWHPKPEITVLGPPRENQIP